MSYIGNTAQNINYVPAIDYFNGDGSTVAFTLSRPVASVAAVQAVISNVPQNPGSAFTVSGSTITFTSAPPSGTANIYVYYTSPNTQVVQPGQGTVGNTQMVTGAAVANIGYTPVNKAGDTMTGALSLSAGNMTLANGQQYCFGANNYNGLSGSSATNSLSFYTNNVQTMGIDSSGRVTTPYQPMFDVGGAVSSNNPGNDNPIIYTSGYIVGSYYSTSTGRFTAPIAGYYHFSGSLLLESMGAGDQMEFGIYKNGANGLKKGGRLCYQANYTGFGGYLNAVFSATVYLAANDYVYAGHSHTGSSGRIYTGSEWSYFNGFLVG